MSDVQGYIGKELARFTSEILEFLRIPSVSAKSEHNNDTRRAAEWLRDRMEAAGLEAEVLETAGHPVVLGEWRGAGSDAPTVLVYGHYDVQPAEPLELWDSPPFEPTERDGRIYARGVSDDKGHLVARFAALPDDECVAPGRVLLGRLAGDRAIFDTPEFRVAIPTLEGLAVEERFEPFLVVGARANRREQDG